MGNALDSIQSASEFKTCYEASWIAENARKACELAEKYNKDISMLLDDVGDADLVVLQDRDVYHAIWHHKEPMVVIKDGKIIVEDK